MFFIKKKINIKNIYSILKFLLIYKLYLDIDEKKIKKESNLKKDFGYDSIDILEFIILIEKKFNINIDYNDQEYFNTIEDYINYIYKKIYNINYIKKKREKLY